MPRVNQITTRMTNWSNKVTKILFTKNGIRLNKKEIAEKIARSERTLSEWNRNVGSIKLKDAVVLANATNVTDEEWLEIRRMY